jgi:acetyl esterase/lipase
VLLYLHGGAFVMGSPSSYRSRAVRLSYRCNAEVLVPDYRLAPEHPFPAALEDALAAWRAAGPIASGRPLLVGGDSAGGGLALSLMVLLRELGEASPRGAVLLSPSANQTRGAVSGRHRDLWLDADRLRQWRRHYLGTADPRDPRVSPALADLSGLPPMLVLVGEDEALAEETYRWVARARGPGPMLVCWWGRDAARLAAHPSLARREPPRLAGDLGVREVQCQPAAPANPGGT